MPGERRFHTLDAMRGVAALCIFALHGYMFFSPLVLPGGYLAVDLFFVLSGFVLAHAYEQRLKDGLGMRRFLVIRLARLYPLYLIGALLGMTDAALALAMHHGDLTPGNLVLGSAALLLMLPMPTGVGGPITPINIPAWSLFFEMAANMAYALIAPRLTTRLLCLAVTALGLWLGWAILDAGSDRLGMAWGTFVGGIPRVGYSFFAGVLLFRAHRRRAAHGRAARVTWLAWTYPLALVPLFAVTLPDRAWLDALCAIVVFPALVYGAAAQAPRRVGGFALLGSISYALYVIHYPALHMLRAGLRALDHDPKDFAPWAGPALAAVAILICWLLDLYYDAPVRGWISRRLHFRGMRSSSAALQAEGDGR